MQFLTVVKTVKTWDLKRFMEMELAEEKSGI
jgi:hypothetical protein